MYIKSIEITGNHFFLKKGFKIENFRNINLIVGDQGCGKSCLLQTLSKNEKVKVDLTELGIQGVDSSYFDFESMNPKVINSGMLTTPTGESRLFGMRGKGLSFFESHGQTLSQYSIKGLKRLKGAVIIFDEPESALSVRSQYKLIKACKVAVKNKCQLFLATHCLPLIQSQPIVYSMEHGEWMESGEFLKTQLR